MSCIFYAILYLRLTETPLASLSGLYISRKLKSGYQRSVCSVLCRCLAVVLWLSMMLFLQQWLLSYGLNTLQCAFILARFLVKLYNYFNFFFKGKKAHIKHSFNNLIFSFPVPCIYLTTSLTYITINSQIINFMICIENDTLLFFKDQNFNLAK